MHKHLGGFRLALEGGGLGSFGCKFMLVKPEVGRATDTRVTRKQEGHVGRSRAHSVDPIESLQQTAFRTSRTGEKVGRLFVWDTKGQFWPHRSRVSCFELGRA